jgi:hypothetical protein
MAEQLLDPDCYCQGRLSGDDTRHTGAMCYVRMQHVERACRCCGLCACEDHQGELHAGQAWCFVCVARGHCYEVIADHPDAG